MHCCLTPWPEEEASSVDWAVHTEGDPWREYLITVWFEEDLLSIHALLFNSLTWRGSIISLLSCSHWRRSLAWVPACCLTWRGFVTHSCTVVWYPGKICYQAIELLRYLSLAVEEESLCAFLTSVCSVICLQLSEEESLWESLSSVCSITCLRLSEEEPLCAFLTSVCSVICLQLSEEESLWESLSSVCSITCLRLSEEESLCEPLTSVCSVTHLWLSEEESLCQSLTSVCFITYLCLPKRNRCVNFLRSLTKKRVGSACAF